jgi:hypothetical protein
MILDTLMRIQPFEVVFEKKDGSIRILNGMFRPE